MRNMGREHTLSVTHTHMCIYRYYFMYTTKRMIRFHYLSFEADHTLLLSESCREYFLCYLTLLFQAHMFTVSQINKKPKNIETKTCHRDEPAPGRAVLTYRQLESKVQTFAIGATYTASFSCG
jgi:hypothetical protein